jgi:hypothetical protein
LRGSGRRRMDERVIQVNIPVIEDTLKLTIKSSTTVDEVNETIIHAISPKIPPHFTTNEFLYFGLLQVTDSQTKVPCDPFERVFNYDVGFCIYLIPYPPSFLSIANSHFNYNYSLILN